MPPAKMRGDGRKAKAPKKTFFRLLSYLGKYKVTMAVVIICIIALFLTEFKENVWFEHVFRGIRSGVLVLMVNAVIKFAKKCPKLWYVYVAMIAAFALAAFTEIDIAFILLAGGLFGIVLRGFMMKEAKIEK